MLTSGSSRKNPLYRLYGAGCLGTGSGLSRNIVLPRGYASTWGESNNIFPWGTSNQRYMQAHAAGDISSTSLTLTVRGLEFRSDRGRTLTATFSPSQRARCAPPPRTGS